MARHRTWRLALALAMGAGGSAAQGGNTGVPSVIVFVKQDNFPVTDLGRAERIATRIFAGIGLRVAFRAGAKPKSMGLTAVAIELQLDGRVPDGFHPGALAYALPYGTTGTRIHVLCDRVHRAWPDGGTGAVLRYVLAHEVAHALAADDRHSTEGLMKAGWQEPDFRQMVDGSMPFTPADAEWIHHAMNQRVANSQPTAGSGRSGFAP